MSPSKVKFLLQKLCDSEKPILRNRLGLSSYTIMEINYTESVKFRSQSLERTSKREPHRGLGNR